MSSRQPLSADDETDRPHMTKRRGSQYVGCFYLHHLGLFMNVCLHIYICICVYVVDRQVGR